MSDWTTHKISADIEIDLHHDLDSFPAVIRSNDLHNQIVLSNEETRKLTQLLVDHFGKYNESS